MRTIIAGSRHVVDAAQVELAIRGSGFEITSVVSGKAKGVDTLGEAWAKARGIPVHPYPVLPADWARYGYSAGPRRNQRMAENADALIAIWDGISRGTKDMIDRALKMGLRVWVHIVEEAA